VSALIAGQISNAEVRLCGICRSVFVIRGANVLFDSHSVEL